MKQHTPLLDLLRRARSRRLFHLAFEGTSLAVSAALAGAILLLVLGTQILDWYWPLALFVVALAVGGYRLRKRIPSAYGLLQAIDRRLHLSDAISTAYYFAVEGQARKVSEEVRAAQRERAEGICRGVDLKQAVPFRVPVSCYVAVLLFAGAGTMFAVRYAVRQSLDLRPPIAESLFEFYRPTTEATMRQPEEPPQPEYEEAAAEDARAERREGRIDPESDSTLSLEEVPEAGDEGLSPDSRGLEEGDPFAAAEDGDEEASGEARESDSQGEGSEASGQSPEADSIDDPSGEKPPAFPPPEDSDLLQKMQDAFAKLMSKLKIPPRAGEGQRTAQQRSNQTGDQKQKRKGRQMPGSEQGEGEPTSDPRGTRTQQGDQQAQAGQGKAGSQASNKPGEQQAPSGMGTKDGSKDVKLAEQMEAMGKLSEIIGRRAENITGEVMVEVTSGDQRLRTAYTESGARHKAAGGKIHRDEVPIELRHYVQRYFEEVRKAPDSEQ
ncbi:MAG: hypothetical protein GY953_40200 [bacterium]|nr:hypothetical protein [bacterium]